VAWRNLLLHATCATFVGLIAWRAAGRDLACGLAAATLFALHPAHAEPVQWITGRVDVLATLLYLAGFLAFLRYRASGDRQWLIAIAGIYAAAAFAKEFGLTLPLMMIAADLVWLQSWRRWRDSRTWLP
jgi:protein O-mannosyl-transferase